MSRPSDPEVRGGGSTRLRRSALVALDGVLAVGTGAVTGLVGSGPASATPTGPPWGAQTAPLPTAPDAPAANPSAVVDDLTCLTGSYCVGLGSYDSSSAGTENMFETYADGSWSATEAPTPGPDAKFDDVTCWDVGACVAVGSFKSGSDRVPVIDQLSDGAWTTVEGLLPGDATSGDVLDWLKSVSCQSDGSCVAVGQYKNGSGTVGLIDTLTDGTWSAAAAPEPSDVASSPDTTLGEVSCPSEQSCVAVGTYENASSDQEGLLLTDSGGTWTAEAAPLPANAVNSVELNALDCVGTTCEAGGSYEDAGSAEHGVLEHLSGGTWTATETPEPSDAGSGTDQSAAVNSIACSAGDSCAAVGFYETAGGVDVGLIDTVEKGTPAAARAPVPADAAPSGTSELISVSCLASGACVTVGDYAPASGSNDIGLVDTQEAGTWSALAAPVPSDAQTGSTASSMLEGVSCAPDGSCAAGGFYDDASANQQGLLENVLPAAPTVTGVTPVSGPAAGGTTVTITGTGFFPASSVAFGSTPATSVTYVSPTQLTAVSPTTATGPTGTATVDVRVTTAGGTSAVSSNDHFTFLASTGYWEAASDGGIFTFGTAAFYGSMGGHSLNASVVGMAATPDRKGYWEVATDGGIFSFGDAGFDGSTGSLRLNAPIVGMAPTPDGNGYWEVASDGGIFNYGNAAFFGSTGNIHLNKAIVGMASTSDGKGYWLVASDGGVFSYGDAGFFGSAGNIQLNKPVVGMAATPDGKGYWLVASDGGVFAYGSAGFYGSAGSITLNQPVVGMAAVTEAPGYWFTASDGGIFAYGAGPFEGSMGGKPLVQPVVGMAEG